VGGDKAKRLLATLLLQPSHTVSPMSCRRPLAGVAAPVGGRQPPDVRQLAARPPRHQRRRPLQTRPSGYRIDLDEQSSDLIRFRTAGRGARQGHGTADTARAGALLE